MAQPMSPVPRFRAESLRLGTYTENGSLRGSEVAPPEDGDTLPVQLGIAAYFALKAKGLGQRNRMPQPHRTILVQCLIDQMWSRGTSLPSKSSPNVVRRRQTIDGSANVYNGSRVSMSPMRTPIQALEAKLNARWKNITSARDLSAQTRSRLRRDLVGLDSDDSSVVISGSLARDEFTSGSDIDWTLLIDGQADPNIY